MKKFSELKNTTKKVEESTSKKDFISNIIEESLSVVDGKIKGKDVLVNTLNKIIEMNDSKTKIKVLESVKLNAYRGGFDFNKLTEAIEIEKQILNKPVEKSGDIVNDIEQILEKKTSKLINERLERFETPIELTDEEEDGAEEIEMKEGDAFYNAFMRIHHVVNMRLYRLKDGRLISIREIIKNGYPSGEIKKFLVDEDEVELVLNLRNKFDEFSRNSDLKESVDSSEENGDILTKLSELYRVEKIETYEDSVKCGTSNWDISYIKTDKYFNMLNEEADIYFIYEGERLIGSFVSMYKGKGYFVLTDNKKVYTVEDFTKAALTSNESVNIVENVTSEYNKEKEYLTSLYNQVLESNKEEKSEACSFVLQGMDIEEDGESKYEDLLKKAVEKFKVNKAELEKELKQYI